MNLARAVFGSFPGGLAVVALVTCAIFTAFTGASGVTIVALGGLLYPILLNRKVSGEIYPRSHHHVRQPGICCFLPVFPLILYALISATISMDKLFAAGMLPGLLLLVALSTYCRLSGEQAQGRPGIRFTGPLFGGRCGPLIWEIPLPVIVIGGIYTGTFTATEAAAVTAFYVLHRRSVHSQGPETFSVTFRG